MSKKILDTTHIDTTTYTDIQSMRLPKQFHKQIVNRIDHEEFQASLVDKELSKKAYYSESTQTEDLSVLNCKDNFLKYEGIKHNTAVHLKCSKNSSIYGSSPVSLK